MRKYTPSELWSSSTEIWNDESDDESNNEGNEEEEPINEIAD